MQATLTSFDSSPIQKSETPLLVGGVSHSFSDIFGAVMYFEKALHEKGFRALHKRFENHDRDCLIHAQKGYDTTSFYLKFKREWFYSYGKIFQGEKGAGESINSSQLDELITKKIDVVIFAHSPHFYWIYAMQIKNYCAERGLIRVQNEPNFYNAEDFTGKLKPEFEETLSFPVELLENFNTYAKVPLLA